MKKIIKDKNIDTKNVNVENVCQYQNEVKNLTILHKMECSEYILEAIADTEKKIGAIKLTEADLVFSLTHNVIPCGKNEIIISKK